MNDPVAPGSADQLTTRHVRRGCEGDDESVAWVVRHFTPALLMQARYRLQGALRRHLEPEDLVDEVWAIALQRLPQLVARDGRQTPVLVRFLGTTLLTRLRTIVRGNLRQERWQQCATASGSASHPLHRVPQDTTSVVARVAHREIASRLHECVDALGERDRQVLVLRGIEQLPVRRVAEILDCSPNAVSAQYRRAIDRLRAALPSSVFAELDGDSRDLP